MIELPSMPSIAFLTFHPCALTLTTPAQKSIHTNVLVVVVVVVVVLVVAVSSSGGKLYKPLNKTNAFALEKSIF